MKYSAWVGHEWQFDVHGNDESDALAKAKSQDSAVDRVELVSESDAGSRSPD